MAARGTIDGIPILTSTPIAWALTSGTAPYVTTVEVARKAVSDPDGLVGKRTTLSVTGPADSFTASGVYVIGVTPGSHPQTLLLTIADKRWLWPRTHILRRYNVRRKTGNRRLKTEGVPEALALAVDDYYYEKATLRGGKSLWTTERAFRDIVGVLDYGDEPNVSGVKFRSVPFENVELDDPGDAALDRVRALSSGLNVYVALDGTTTAIDETDLAAATAVLRKFGPPIVGGGIAGVTKRGGIRPKYVDVLFPVECELKFTSTDEGGTYSTRGREDKFCENVLAVPDVSLTLSDGRVCARGTWITVDEAFAAWGTPSLPPSNGQSVSAVAWSHDTVQKYWLGGLDRLFTDVGMVVTDSDDEAARVASIRQHYRQTYRISQYWMARIRSLSASRVAIIDEENGTRAPAYVTSNYAYTPNTRGRFFDPANSGWIVNVSAYSDGLAQSKQAPVVLTILDEQLGVVRLDYQKHARNLWDEVYPCTIGNVPVADFRKGRAAPVVTGDATYGTDTNAPFLSPSHKVAFVLTASPSAPNSNDQLYRHRVEASVVSGFGINATPSTGPGMEVRVGLGATSAGSARFAWSDDKDKTIDAMFGRGSTAEGGRPSYTNGAGLAAAGLLVDSDEVQQIAEATAAAVYSTLTDRVVGRQSTRLGRATIKPAGNCVEVVFSESADGALNTTANFNQTAGRVDVTALLSSDVRRKLLRLAQP